MAVGLEYYLIVSALLFAIGAYGVLTSRNGIVLLMCLEIMINAGTINLVAFSSYSGDPAGQSMAILALAVAAGEVAVGLAIMLGVYRNWGTIRLGEANELKW